MPIENPFIQSLIDTEAPPEKVIIDGEEYTLNKNFNACFLSLYAWKSKDLADDEKVDIILHNMYVGEPPTDVEKALNAAVNYLNEFSKEKTSKKKPLICFARDYNIIRKDFLAIGIDLATTGFEWYEFTAKLGALHENATIYRIMHLRSQREKGKLTKEERDEWANYGDEVMIIGYEEDDDKEPWLD